MSKRVFLVVSVILSLLQGSILPPVFLEGTLLVYFIFSNPARNPWPVFLAGFIFDLLTLQRLGLTAAIFLIAGAVCWLLKEQVHLRRPLYLSLLAVGIDSIRSQILYGKLFSTSDISVFLVSLFIFSFVLRPGGEGIIKVTR